MTQPQDDSELLVGAYDGVPEDDQAEPLDADIEHTAAEDEIPDVPLEVRVHDHEVGQ